MSRHLPSIFRSFIFLIKTPLDRGVALQESDDDGERGGEELKKRAGLDVRMLKISTKHSSCVAARPAHNQAAVESPASCSALYETPLPARGGAYTILRPSLFLALSEGGLSEHFFATGPISKEIVRYRMFVLAGKRVGLEASLAMSAAATNTTSRRTPSD